MMREEKFVRVCASEGEGGRGKESGEGKRGGGGRAN